MYSHSHIAEIQSNIIVQSVTNCFIFSQ